MADRVPKVLLSAGMIQSGHSGVGRYVVELANRISKMGTVELHVAGLDEDRRLFGSVDDRLWISIPPSSAGGLRNLLWHQFKLPTILRSGGFDLLHIPSYRRVVASCPITQLATIHDCAPFRLRDKYGLLRGFFGRHVAPWLARRCDHVLTVSEFTKRDLIHFFKLPSTGVEVVYNGLNHETYRPATSAAVADFRERHGFKQPFLLFISRLEHPGKNHLRLIEAYERYRETSGADMLLVLAGAPWHGAEVIESRVRESAFADSIRLPGFVVEEELPLWYAAAEALVFPSLMEGFGLPVVEALACGLRVASSNRGSLPEVGGDAAVYFDPEDVVGMAEAILQLCQEPAEARQARIDTGIVHAAGFNWDVAAKVTCQTYSKMGNIAE